MTALDLYPSFVSLAVSCSGALSCAPFPLSHPPPKVVQSLLPVCSRVGPDKPRVDLGDRCSLAVQAAPREGCGCQVIHQLSTPIALSCPVTEMWLSSSYVPGQAEVFGRPERGETFPLTPYSSSCREPGVLKPAEVTAHTQGSGTAVVPQLVAVCSVLSTAGR